MKKIRVLVLLFSLALFIVVGCNASKESNVSKQTQESGFVPDITIDDIDWNVKGGSIQGENYVVFAYTNNSEFDIKSLEMDFVEKDSITQKEKDLFYADVQKSQGFDDEWMEEYITSREELSQPISMYARCDDVVLSGESTAEIKCYYMGGWTSKNVVYPDIVEAEKLTIEYEKDGVAYTLYYNFESGLYDVETN